MAHLSTLHQNNLLSSETMLKCIDDMQDVMKVLDETQTRVWPVWVDQRDKALEVAAAKEAEASAAVWQQENSTSSPSRMVRWVIQFNHWTLTLAPAAHSWTVFPTLDPLSPGLLAEFA